MGYLPLHARCIFMFDHLKVKQHSCFMDNIYLSALFCKRSQNSGNQVKLYSVTRGELKGISKCILQTESQNKELQCAVHGTVKTAIFQGGPKIDRRVALSIYNSKPAYFFSTTIESIMWNTNKKKSLQSTYLPNVHDLISLAQLAEYLQSRNGPCRCS